MMQTIQLLSFLLALTVPYALYKRHQCNRLMQELKAKPKGPAVPPPPAKPPEETYLRIVKVDQQPRYNNSKELCLDFVCITCGRYFSRWLRDAESDGVDCKMCGQTAPLEAIRAWMRQELHKATEDACIFCFMGPDKHVGDKCLFDSQTYTPRNRKAP